MRILFWNTYKRQEALDELPKVAIEEDVDIIALAELPSRDAAMLQNVVTKLNSLQPNVYDFLPIVGDGEKVFVFFRKDKAHIKNAYNEDKLFVKKIKGADIEISIVFCHLDSKVNASDETLARKAEKFKALIEEYEKVESKDNKTIVCGDFNMNPYESGMLGACSFNAMMDKRIALKKKRRLDGDDYNFFYNPMWGCLGDNGKGGTPGTHYLTGSEYTQPYWHMLDQVILRPDVIPYFDDNGLKILKSGRTYSLVSRDGHPDKKKSDHFPILFTLINI